MNQPDHPSIGDLADLREGLLAGRRADEVAAHLPACPECAEAVAGLAAVSSSLAEEGRVAVPMPSEVASALDEAIARASAERSAGVPSLAEHRTAAARRRLARAGRRWPLLAGAATVVVVLGAVVPNLDLSTDESHDASGGASQSQESADRVQGASRRPHKSAASLRASAAPARPPVTGPRQVAAFARSLDGTSRSAVLFPSASACPGLAEAPETSRSFALVITWRDEPAVLRVDRRHRVATVLDCLSGSTVLFRTSY